MPLFTIMSLILVYPYFKGNQEKYFLICFLAGLCYDFIYTDMIVINAILFLCIGIITAKLNLLFSNNTVNVSIMAIICIVFYRTVMYGLLLITGNIDLGFIILFRSIYRSILLNIFYIVLGFIITDRISKKFKIKKIN